MPSEPCPPCKFDPCVCDESLRLQEEFEACSHWWLIPDLDGSKAVEGWCRLCGETRLFKVDLHSAKLWNTREKRAVG
jgi:hypothetical protein